MAHKRERLQRVRKSTGLTQEGIARRLGVEVSTVWRWEAGETEPSAWMQPRLAKLLRVTRAELVELLVPEAPPQPKAPEPSHAKSADESSDAAEESVLESAYFESVTLSGNLEASSLGAATLQQLGAAVENFGLDYLHVPPRQTLRDAATTRRFVMNALDRKHTLRQQRELYAVGGWLSALIGHVSFDVGESFGVVDGHLTTALAFAREIDQTELISWIHGTQALSAVFRNRPQAAIHCAQAGLAVADEQSIMRVRLLAQEARAHARVGDEKQAERRMAAAERAFDTVAKPLSTSIFSFDRPYLSYYAGTCYSWLGKPRLAGKHSREAIVLCDRAADDWPVARVFARIDLAEALIQQGDLDEASGLARACLDICLYGRRTALVETRLRELVAKLTTAIGNSQTRHLAEQFHTIFRDGTHTSDGS